MSELETVDRGVLFRNYTPDAKDTLLDAFDELSLTRRGVQAIRQRFGWECNRGQFERLLDDGEIVRILAVTPTEHVLMGWGEYVVNKAAPTRAELFRLVMPEHQGRGVGTELIGRLLGLCREQNPGVSTIESVTQPSNAAAIYSLIKAQKVLGGKRIDVPAKQQVRFKFSV